LPFQRLDLPRDRRRVNAELAREIHDAEVGTRDGQKPHEHEMRRWHPDPPRQSRHEHLVGADDFSKQMGLVAAVAHFFDAGRGTVSHAPDDGDISLIVSMTYTTKGVIDDSSFGLGERCLEHRTV
jgi:hypothetical protein